MADDTGDFGNATTDGEVGANPRQALTDEELRNQWIELFSVDAAPELHPEMFDEAIGELDRLLKARPDAKEEAAAVLERQFDRGLLLSPWAAVTNRLADYWGMGPAYLLNWLVYQNTESRLAMLDRRADAEVVRYVRWVVARFWDELNAAQLSVSTSVDDWARIEKRVYHDALEGTYRLSINLIKLNGEVVTLETTPDSLVNLTDHLLAMIAAIDDVAEFSPERASLFQAQLGPVYALFNPPDAAEEDAGAREDAFTGLAAAGDEFLATADAEQAVRPSEADADHS